MAEILTPRCPLCHQLPEFNVGSTQAFCGNDACDLWFWNPAASLDDTLMDAGDTRWEPTEEGQ